MTEFPKWRDVRSKIVAAAGGEEGVAAARRRNQAYIDGHHLAEAAQGTRSLSDGPGPAEGGDEEPGLPDRAWGGFHN